MSGDLEQRIAEGLAAPVHPAVTDFAERLGRENEARAVLFYGSNLRTGSLEGVLDFYLLMPGSLKERIWPRISYREWERGDDTLRAKIATMPLETFTRAAKGDLLDTTIWTRFVQPSALVWQRDFTSGESVRHAISAAAQTAARLAAALGPPEGNAEDYWRALFRATYRAEFRIEPPGRENSILSVNADHFDGLFSLALEAQGLTVERRGMAFIPHVSAAERRNTRKWWAKRRRFGKLLNLLRLAKASTTFDGAARYAAWKIERHTGIALEVTPWRERHPLLAAPGVLWQLWRAKRG